VTWPLSTSPPVMQVFASLEKNALSETEFSLLMRSSAVGQVRIEKKLLMVLIHAQNSGNAMLGNSKNVYKLPMAAIFIHPSILL
jgi:hypothetical protein